jgi:hypothetical protein
MENEVSQLVHTMNQLLVKGDWTTAWNMQGEISRVFNSLPRGSEERNKITEVWEKMMNKWH